MASAWAIVPFSAAVSVGKGIKKNHFLCTYRFSILGYLMIAVALAGFSWWRLFSVLVNLVASAMIVGNDWWFCICGGWF